MEQKPKESKAEDFEITYIKPDNYKTFFSTGIIGGQTLNGLININFVVDTVKLPEKAIKKIEGDRIGPIETLSKTAMGSNREMLVGILVDVNTAKVIAEWLHKRIETVEAEINKLKELKK